MKTKTFLLSALLVCNTLAFTSCNDDDNYTPEDVVVNAFKSKYPQATKVEWETKAGYKVADFHFNKNELEAWFEPTGEWVMTETDITYNELPQAVQNSFKASSYADWKVDDVDKLERHNTETVYIIEVEQGKQEVDLYYTEDGSLIKEINDNGANTHEPLVVPNSVIEEIKERYPNAQFLEFEREGSYIEIDIRHNNIQKDVLYNSSYEWVSTTWEIRLNDVPQVVLSALKASEYSSYKVDDVDFMEKPDGAYYIFELESGNKEVYLTIKSDGTIINK
ncbi:putative membrane protein YkoI [Parabacteroides sp. PF5-5]|uniref:PepSY-like domain-containing protein n=1 Tax=unclassified Parabacteroides TaxID=2649774 RepID=UPI002476694E|nr:MULTISPECIES: PepSY-like domain-containing protein [unclassified Parabacteroides]MDH6305085.1 putative membrane protein YkoI [Parabacteroides sp. PH5-39]MDH6316435.1 putative membrane protein YkoI [Parabacteroides sp. PF5-13]MDH6319945.1 putative membrane protein YkoI [Parabacteroides sp. PH5-13]MDH6323822.1 putative membrane protein YkoI [Parabacteroides sp. PH5-8]MDH6327622.1 putative membrane protein YkoI [Parabacteroides sp. PH5-41]